MKTELISIEEYQQNIIKQSTFPKLNGIECPKCKSEMMDKDTSILCSFPPKKSIICSNEQCKYHTYVYC